jgi:hypothetical protein
MAKVIWRTASEDDPIYKEGFQVSSQSYSREYAKSKTSSAKDTVGALTQPSTQSTMKKAPQK